MFIIFADQQAFVIYVVIYFIFVLKEDDIQLRVKLVLVILLKETKTLSRRCNNSDFRLKKTKLVRLYYAIVICLNKKFLKQFD